MANHEATSTAATNIGPKMDAWERQQIFREMVIQQLRNGPLNRNRRRQLVRYAAGLGINAVQAGHLIQQAHHQANVAEPASSPLMRMAGSESSGHTWKMLIITLAILAAVQSVLSATM